MTGRSTGPGEDPAAVASPGMAAGGDLGLRVEADQADAVTTMARAVGLSAQSLATVLAQMRRLGLRGPGYDPTMPAGFEYDMLAGFTVELLAWAKAASAAAEAARRRLIVVRRTLLRPD